MQHRTITALLAVVAVLLTLNLAVSLSRRAEAQPQVQTLPRVTGVSMTRLESPTGNYVAVRIWSDGLLEWRIVTLNFSFLPGSEWAAVQEDQP